jgi:hypothetical protein
MTIQFSASVRNGMLDAIETAMGVSAKLQLYSGIQPANCATAASGTKLAEYALASDWAAAASAGSKALSSLPLSTTALVGGTAGYYRFVDNAGTTCHEQGSVTLSAGGGDMTIDNTTFTSGQTVQVTGFSKTAPGA